MTSRKIERKKFIVGYVVATIWIAITIAEIPAPTTADRTDASLSTATAAGRNGDDRVVDDVDIPLEDLSNFITYATSYLCRVSHNKVQDELFEGRFTYEANLQRPLQLDSFSSVGGGDESGDDGNDHDHHHYHPQKHYNLLRHNGALYALSQSYLRLVTNQNANNNKDPLQQKQQSGLKGRRHKPKLQKQQQRKQQEYDGKDFKYDDDARMIDATLNQIKIVLLRGSDYLKRDAIFPVPDRTNTRDNNHKGMNIPGLLAAWEKENISSPTSNLYQAKLGGAGLALIALTQVERIVEPTTTSLDYMRQIANFIEYMQKQSSSSSSTTATDRAINDVPRRTAYDDLSRRRQQQEGELSNNNNNNQDFTVPADDDGSFVCKYNFRHGPDDSWTSLYYPGEAALGLVMLAEIESDVQFQQKWIHIATKALLYLERLRRYQHLETIEPDHWALLATSRILPFLNSNTVEYWLIYQHGVRVAQSMVSSHTRIGLKEHHGCFTYDRRTCPTSTRLEGLLAALSFIDENEMFVSEREQIVQPLRDRIMEDVTEGIRFLLSSQQTTMENNMLGAVPERYPIDATAKDSADQDSNVRIDYPQHSMSAVIAYEKFVLSQKGQQDDNTVLKKNNGRRMIVGTLHRHVHKMLSHNYYDMDGSSIVDSWTLIANLCLMGAILGIAIVLVRNVFSPPTKRRRRQLGKNK